MKQTILQTWQSNGPTVKSTPPQATGEGVVDEAAFNTIEVDKLFDAVNHASTTIGQAVLYRSLTQPSDDFVQIQAKQDAVRELEGNAELAASLENIVQNAVDTENNFYRLLFAEFVGSFSSSREEHEIEGYGHLHYRRGVRFLVELVDEIQHHAAPQSIYLQGLFDKIKAFSDSRAYSLMTNSVYITEQGLQSKQDRQSSFAPALIFQPYLFKPVLITLFFAAVWVIAHFFPTDFFQISKDAISTAAIFFVPLLLIYFPVVGGFDRDSCIIPLRNVYKNSPEVGEVLDALGQIDELLSFIKFSKAFAHPVILPTLTEADHHRIHLSKAINPVLGKENAEFVANDFVLDDDKLILITGSNSGGKTAFCKTLTQIQVLAQIGSYVPAQTATLTVADRIFYQVSEVSHLNDGEGRFGTELKRTKDIFLACTPKSLVVLDELSEGTTFEEKMESSYNVLSGFYRLGNSTVLITHNHQLVDMLVKQRMGVPKQVEFADDAPTFKLISGISRVSHADRVAKKIGFSKEDIDNYLADKK